MRTLFMLLLCSMMTMSLSAQSVSFKLKNTGVKSIPLIIPGVMNPNLSPMSWSGVNLKIGQKVFFRYRGKRQVLFKVDESYEGQKVNVNKLIKKRKSEIDQKST